MSVSFPAKRFIPFTKHDLIQMTLSSIEWSETDKLKVELLAQQLNELLHYEFHQDLEHLKNNYVGLNPDRDTNVVFPPKDIEANQDIFTTKLENILTAANYDKITRAELDQALATESLVKLQLHVDFNDFEKVLFYGRGERQHQVEIKSLFGLRRKNIQFTRYDRVVIYFEVKDTDYFAEKPIPPGLTPGSTLLKMFRNVPKADLEMLFPNTEVRMRLLDKLLIGIPAMVSGGVVLTTKLGSTLLLIGAFASFWLGISDQPVVLDQTALIALAAGMATLGGFLWKQFSKFKNRKIQFMKTLTDNLYFRNLDNNAGVFYRLIDDAEEEEFKEAFMAYIFLVVLTEQEGHQEGVTQQVLDQRIEKWFQQSWQTNLDFEIDDALKKLKRMGLVITEEDRLQPIALATVETQLADYWQQHRLKIAAS